MELKVEVARLTFEDLTVKEKFEFVEWLIKEHENYVSFAQLNPGARKVFAHFWGSIAKELGYDTERLTTEPVKEDK